MSIIPLLLGLVCVQAQSSMVSGVVYQDLNKNGSQDSKEPSIPGVMVSNQREVVLTDDEGRYQLPLMDQMIVFVTKPSGYELPLNENHQPQFYYIHQPHGSPADLQFAGLDPTGPLPKSVDFALYKTSMVTDFKAIIVGDPQPRDLRELGYYRDDVVKEMYDRDAAFYLAQGDIAFDDLSIYEEYNQVVGKLAIPIYNVHGNHDMNFDVSHDSLATETFKQHFGPADYSFNYGKVHFVVLDNVHYEGWDSINDKNGSYYGHLNDQQLQWLKNDLSHIPEDYLVVLNTHIPLFSPLSDAGSINTVNREALFKLLENRQRLVALSAHTHYIDQLQLGLEHGWQGEATFDNINVGAACGAWWSGPMDARGIPFSYSLDGSPNGFYLFSFSENNFNHRYIPANNPANEQMRISFPTGRVKQDSIVGEMITVNIFNADPKTTVDCLINDGPPLRMQQQSIRDPFMVDYLKSSDQFPNWVNEAVKNQHMWTLPVPTDLEPGVHSILIKATDSKDNSYQGFQIFIVE